ncbi:MAG: glycosyltransferase family 4 protein [bacterium]
MSRILFITSKPYYPWEGACHRIRHNLEALVTLDHIVDLLTVPVGQAPQVPGVNIFFVPRIPFCSSLPEGPSVRRFILDTLMLFKAVYLAGRTPYTLIHGIDDCGVIAWLAGRLTHTPCVFERHVGLSHEHVKGPRRLWLGIYRFLERRALKKADAVIGNDTSVIGLLARLGRRSRACVIPDIPAITEEPSGPSRNLAQARFRTSPGQKLVTCVGSYTRFQGLDLFFNALPQVLAKAPQTRFVVVGGDAAEILRMRKALARADIGPAVAFPGRMQPSELAALLAVSDVLVSPRRAGVTAPIKVLDYLHSGTPIAAANTPANRAVLSPENALITRPTPEALADGILKLCNAPALGAELSLHGRATLTHENRTPEAFCNALRRCYTYVLTTPLARKTEIRTLKDDSSARAR